MRNMNAVTPRSRRHMALCLIAAASAAAFLLGPGAIATAQTKAQAKPKAKTKAKKAGPSAATIAANAKAREEANNAVAEWLASPPIIENPAALIPFLEQLYRLEHGGPGLVRILHYGDSHTAADEWTGTIRSLLQTKFGDGGAGFSHAGRPWNSYRRLDVRSFGSPRWYSDGLLGREGDGLYGISGVSITTSLPGQTAGLKADCESAELLYLKQPRGGPVDLYDNGVFVERIPTEGETGAGYYKLPMAPGAHYFEVRTVERAPVRLYGWATENNRGVTYETLGINGAMATIMEKWDAALQAEHIAHRNPALIVLAYGTNESASRDWNQPQGTQEFAAIIKRLRAAAPSAAILVIGPPDRYYMVRGVWTVHPKIDGIAAAQRDAAKAAGVAFWDIRERMGGSGAMREWVRAGLAQGDYIHFTAPGYRLLGAAMYKELLEQYRTFIKVREEPPKPLNTLGESK